MNLLHSLQISKLWLYKQSYPPHPAYRDCRVCHKTDDLFFACNALNSSLPLPHSRKVAPIPGYAYVSTAEEFC